MFIVQCPKCKQKMRYMPSRHAKTMMGTKRCVYCGRSFKVKDHIKKKT